MTAVTKNIDRVDGLHALLAPLPRRDWRKHSHTLIVDYLHKHGFQRVLRKLDAAHTDQLSPAAAQSLQLRQEVRDSARDGTLLRVVDDADIEFEFECVALLTELKRPDHDNDAHLLQRIAALHSKQATAKPLRLLMNVLAYPRASEERLAAIERAERVLNVYRVAGLAQRAVAVRQGVETQTYLEQMLAHQGAALDALGELLIREKTK